MNTAAIQAKIARGNARAARKVLPSMDLSLQKRLAMDILSVGQRKVWIDPTKKYEVLEAKSREAVRQLIREGVIRLKNCPGVALPAHLRRTKPVAAAADAAAPDAAAATAVPVAEPAKPEAPKEEPKKSFWSRLRGN
eukprot:TRINITY_DN14685_c0_g1_i1.p1 TRINITY_DN14685_c0_g1~~TRINITY_DN14685_c0_g1_i1.p1  ORF type:complete len:156 (+),score=6.74 TRINITY_DN14685_c0_g1_i1:59-469(+)